MLTNQKKISAISYIPARFVTGKEWFVCYYAIHPTTGQLRRKRIKLNRIKNIAQRRAVARKLVIEINEKLYNGWNPFIEDAAAKSYHRIIDALATYMEIQERDLEKNSLRSYRCYTKFIGEYIIKKLKMPDMYICQFDKTAAVDFMFEVKRNPKLSNRTYNNYLHFYKTLFNWFKQYNYITVNPFEGLPKIARKKLHKIRQTITAEIRKSLYKYLAEHNPNYLAMCMICYYCFLRPNEISYLTVGDVDLAAQTIKVRKEIAKNDNDSLRIIPDAMMPCLRRLKLSGNRRHYLFSFDKKYLFTPGTTHADSREIARYWNRLRPVIGIPMNVQFYSLKDSGITNMLADGVAANFVQGQADHSSLEITSIYAATQTPESMKQIKEKAKAFF